MWYGIAVLYDTAQLYWILDTGYWILDAGCWILDSRHPDDLKGMIAINIIFVDMQSSTPLYLQIIEQVTWLICQGVLKPGQQLPSIRSLANELELNVNTVKRAFSELEAMGVTYSLPGRGIFICENPLANNKIKQDALKEMKLALSSAKSRGLSRDDIVRLAEEVFNDEEDKKTRSYTV